MAIWRDATIATRKLARQTGGDVQTRMTLYVLEGLLARHRHQRTRPLHRDRCGAQRPQQESLRKDCGLARQYAGILKPVSQFIPFPGAAAAGEAAAAALSGLADTTNSDRSAKKVREEITKELTALTQPIVVIIDDIDRLTTVEIREIFKFVRLTASFPNIIYVLAFDRERVEQALTEDGVPGRAYLEKIVQLSFDVPQAPEKLLRSQVFEELNRILAPVANATLDDSRWSDVYWEVIDPLFSNMRDVTRYAISTRSTIKSLGDEVDLVDLLAMEALRVFRPELIQQLSTLRSELTSTRPTSGGIRPSNSSRAGADLAVMSVGARCPECTRALRRVSMTSCRRSGLSTSMRIATCGGSTVALRCSAGVEVSSVYGCC